MSVRFVRRRALRLLVATTAPLTLLAAGCGSTPPAPEQALPALYSQAQAGRGTTLYRDTCASCHGETLGGNLAPPLAGEAFTQGWSGRPLPELVEKIQKTMPENEPGRLTQQEATDLVAFLLQENKFPAGASDLVADSAAAEPPRFPVVATATAGAPAGTAAAPTLEGLPAGNLAQVMRGILFPSSNLIFNAQSQDPGAPRPAYDASAANAGFGWADWGAGIYSGWQLVDYAAISIAETAPMLLTPGRRCENGRPVPIDRPDWIKFTNEMVAAGRAAYVASQSRNQDAVIAVTEQLSDSCLHCHEVYRDKPGGTTADPSNKAARCVP